MARKQLRHIERKPLIVICSEGSKKSSEYYYFRNLSSRNLRIQFSTGNCTDPKGMLNDLIKYIQNEDIKSEDNCRIFLVLDTDLNYSRVEEIKSIEKECAKHNIEIITSAPTFEIWFLMHFRNSKLVFQSSQDVKKELKKLIPNYTETMDIYNIISDKFLNAVKLAKKIAKESLESDSYLKNPHSDIYKIMDAIDILNSKK